MHAKIRELNQELEAQYIKTPHIVNKKPVFGIGDTIKVHVAIREGDKERVQVFEGIVIKIKASGLNGAYTVRKVSGGVSVVRTFPFASPFILKVERIRTGDVRRAKLYYLEALQGKAARIKDKESV
jgi:large subunit ribosomal protein L19